MKLKRFVAIVISLAMVLSIVPAFSLTASAESLAADAELVFDGAFGVGASTYSVEFTMGGSNFGYKDTGMVDTVGNYIGGFCYAGPSDGFYPADGERSVALSSGFGQTSDTGGSTKWTSGSSRMNITFNILTDSTYEVVYTCDGTYVATVTYSGSPQGITHPLAWKGTGWGSASPAYDNVVITVDGETVYDESNLPDLATASDWYAMEFTLSTGRDGATSGYRDWQIKDADGNQFTGFCFAGTTDGFYPGDRQSLSSGFSLTSTNSDTSTTWTSMSTKMRVAVTKGSGTYTVTYTKIEGSTETELSSFTYSGTPNGISLPYEWATTGGSGTFTFANVQVYAVVPETTKDITATYTVDGTTVKTQTKTIDTSVTSTASFDAYYYRVNGTNTLYYAATQTLSDSATIEMTLLDNWGNYAVGDSITVNSTPYVVKSGNIVPNGDFEHGMNGWYARDNSTPPVSYSITTSDKPSVSTRAALSSGAGGASSNNSIKTGWDITVGTTYYYSLWVKAGDQWHGFGESDSPTTESQSLIANSGFGTSGTWVQKTGVFTASQEYLVFFEGWSSVGLADVEVYEVEVDSSKIANTTIKFVDSSNTSAELQTAVTVTGVVGDVITIADYAPSTITYNGNPYSFDSTNPTNYTVVGNNDVVTLTYTTDAYVKFTADAVTVIAGNDPVMPTTVTAVTGAGSTTTVTGATWTGYTGLSAGTHTINGTVTVDGTTLSGSTTVTVLPMTFEVSDITGNASGATVNFPADVTGDFYIEFDYNASNLDNMWIYASANGAMWGSGQIGLGWDADGNGYFRAQPAAQTDIQFETNKTYRFLVHGNVDTDTYDLAVYDTVTKAVVFTCDDYGFRSGSDVINSIAVSSNGEGGVATLSNIKVYAPDQASQFTTYTVVATGSVSDTYTTTAVNVDKLTIPYYPGNIVKSRSVSGTTVTFTYEATETSLGSWAIRNNVTSKSWISEMKYLGTHNSFAYNTSVVENEGGALRNDADGLVLIETSHTVPYASSTSTTVINNSRAQSLDALDQLNAGVRYFDIRLTRQEDGTFWVFHGPAFADFRPIAATIGQWAKENPGEVIILDFHYAWDALYGTTYDVITDNDTYYGATQGDDNQYFYTALEELLTETGIMELVPTNFDQRYGAMTAEGTKTAIITVSKGRGANCISKFQSRDSWTSGDTTYNGDSDYDSVVSTIESAISAGAFGSGPKFGVIHAYTTPISLGSAGDSLIDAADANRSKWINEDLDTWMTSGYGDILLMNNVTDADITTYLARISEYNRDYMDDLLGSEFHGETALTAGELTMTGATTSVPFSTEFVVSSTAATGTYTIDGVEYTAHTAYELDLMQFDTDSVALTGEVTVTFPKVSADSTTVDALLSSDGTQVYWTAGVDEAVAIPTTALADVILATRVAPGKEYTVNYVANGATIYTTTETVPYGQVVYSVPAGDFYLSTGEVAYILNSTTAASHTAASTDTTTTFTVDVTIVTENAVLTDTFGNNNGSNDCNNTENMLFVGSSGISDPGDSDAAGDAVMANNGGNVGSPRIPVLMFNVPEVAEGKAVKLHLYVAKANQNLNNGGSMKLAANVADVTVDEALGYVASSIANTTGVVWSDTMFTATTDAVDGRMDVNAWVEIDVTEFVKAATGDTITFTLYAPTAGAYVADREKAVAGGTYEGKAAYLEIVDANKVSVSGAALVVKSGKDVTAAAADGILVPAGSAIKVRETEASLIAFTDGTNVYTTNADGWVTLTPSSAAEYSAATLGVAMVDGAQVRIGDGVNADGTVAGNSGLRFITTVDKSDSLAAITGATFGVEITAESSTEVVDIPTTEWQTEGEVYTSALTNLAISNYNRNFTAKPYVSINGTKYYGSEVTRSIYQVASGLLATGYDGSYGESADETGKTDYTTMPEVLVKVLNGYVNQVGVRLLIQDGVLVKSDKYTGSADTFFTVSNASTTDNVYTCTLTAVGDAKINTGLFNTYVRINNNNSAVKTLVSVVDNNDGTYTLTFDGSSLVTE